MVVEDPRFPADDLQDIDSYYDFIESTCCCSSKSKENVLVLLEGHGNAAYNSRCTLCSFIVLDILYRCDTLYACCYAYVQQRCDQASQRRFSSIWQMHTILLSR